jgi:glycosyltransferase involved in cell wall biosynthesis
MSAQRSSLVLVMDGDFVRNGSHPASRRFGYSQFLFRYADVFEDVRVLARVKEEDDPKAERADGPRVAMLPLTYTRDIGLFLRQLAKVAGLARKIGPEEAVILRVPGFFPLVFGVMLILRRTPYAVEVMADPALTYSKNSYNVRGRVLLKLVMVALTKLVCRKAHWSSYVTRRALQDDYPPAPGAPTTDYTTLNLPRAFVRPEPRERADARTLRLVQVGVMQKHIKGQDIMIRAVALLKQAGVPCTLDFVGDGENRGVFEAMAAEYGVADRVAFGGFASWGDELVARLDAADVFVLPSRQEGLPRALIEASARGLVCYASDLPGNRELAEDAFIVSPNTPEAWAQALTRAHALTGEAYRERSAASLAVAERYVADVVHPRRLAFYRAVAGAEA